MARHKRHESASPSGAATELRIIGGDLRGRKLEYHGDPRTRPMKDRVREAVFNLVDAKGYYAIDLFAGTGALGLEAISRGARGALFIERHFPTVKLIEQNAQQLGIQERCRVTAGSSLVWARRPDAPADSPWLVFCSPPYDFYVSRISEMMDLVERLIASSPPHSTLVVESDERFDPGLLPQSNAWETRVYPPAVISIFRTS
jgi:16S rRNA (guanine(966)-N(2))-methyltransferase RsmD